MLCVSYECIQHNIININKKITLNYPKYNNVCSYGIFFLGTQERVRNNRGSVFEPLKVYCMSKSSRWTGNKKRRRLLKDPSDLDLHLSFRKLHGPSMFAVRAKIYEVLYNQASSIAFDEISSHWSGLKRS